MPTSPPIRKTIVRSSMETVIPVMPPSHHFLRAATHAPNSTVHRISNDRYTYDTSQPRIDASRGRAGPNRTSIGWPAFWLHPPPDDRGRHIPYSHCPGSSGSDVYSYAPSRPAPHNRAGNADHWYPFWACRSQCKRRSSLHFQLGDFRNASNRNSLHLPNGIAITISVCI